MNDEKHANLADIKTIYGEAVDINYRRLAEVLKLNRKVSLVKPDPKQFDGVINRSPLGYYDEGGFLTVGEMIEHLKQFDPDLPIVIRGEGWEADDYMASKIGTKVDEDPYVLSRYKYTEGEELRNPQRLNEPGEPVPFLSMGVS